MMFMSETEKLCTRSLVGEPLKCSSYSGEYDFLVGKDELHVFSYSFFHKSGWLDVHFTGHVEH